MGLRLSYLNWVDSPAASVTADAEAGDFVATNVQNRLGYKVWRTDGLEPGTTDAGLDVDFGAEREVGALGLMFPRTNDISAYDNTPAIGPSDTVRVRLYASNVEVYDSGAGACGVLQGYGTWSIWLEAPVTADAMRLDIDAISRGTEGFLDVSRVWAGPYISPRVGPSYGANRSWPADSIIAKAARGASEFVTPQESMRLWSFTLDWLDETETEELDEMERLASSAAQMLAHRTDLPAGKRDMFCRQASSSGVDASRFQLHRKSFRLIETF